MVGVVQGPFLSWPQSDRGSQSYRRVKSLEMGQSVRCTDQRGPGAIVFWDIPKRCTYQDESCCYTGAPSDWVLLFSCFWEHWVCRWIDQVMIIPDLIIINQLSKCPLELNIRMMHKSVKRERSAHEEKRRPLTYWEYHWKPVLALRYVGNFFLCL